MNVKSPIHLLVCYFLAFSNLVEANKSTNKMDEPMLITSGEAEYNGTDISLTGNVCIEHGLGKIHAHQLKLSPSADHKKKFAYLDIEDDVVIKLKEGGQLHCQLAHIDYLNLHADFLGNAKQTDVVYTEQTKTNNNNLNSSPLILKSKKIQANLSQEYNPKENAHKTSITHMQAEDDVRAYYNQNYLISSDSASYQPLSNNPQRSSGTLLLAVKNPKVKPCSIVSTNGDTIKSSSIAIDTHRQLLTCNESTGSFSLNANDNKKQDIQFSADFLTWDDSKQMLVLNRHILIHFGEFGELSTDKEIRIEQYIIDNKKAMRSLTSLEQTELSYVDLEKNIHKLICQGPLTIDHEHMRVIMESSRDGSGKFIEEKQVYLEDILGDMYADTVLFDYTLVNNVLNPTKITMEGNVKIHNRFDGHVQESGSILQYTLADYVEYFPQKKEMFLYGKNGGRVLFYDKVNNVQMSAPSLKVRRDEKSPKGSIQGMGDVRFTFIEHEFNQLREHFHLKDSLK